MFGCMLAAIGVYSFAVAADFPLAGFTGISLLIHRLTGFPIGLAMVLLNVPMAIVCYRLLGRRFFLHSIFGMAMYSLMIDWLALLPWFPVFEVTSQNRLLAALGCGVIAGTGFAIIYMQNASVGGADFAVLAIKAKRPHLSMGKIILVADTIPIVAGGLFFRDIDGMIYGLIISVVYAVVIDRLIYGVNAGKLLLIVCDDSTLIRRTIEESSGRGCTVWQAQGGWQGDERQVVMCACDNSQMYKVQKAVMAVDPAAFTITLEASQVAGQGFRRLVLGEKQT